MFGYIYAGGSQVLSAYSSASHQTKPHTEDHDIFQGTTFRQGHQKTNGYQYTSRLQISEYPWDLTPHTRSQQQIHLISVPRRRTRSSTPQQWANSPRQRFSGQSALSTGSSSGEQTLLSFFSVLHSALNVRKKRWVSSSDLLAPGSSPPRPDVSLFHALYLL